MTGREYRSKIRLAPPETAIDKVLPSHYDRLVAELTGQITAQPDNVALRLRLLELYYETQRAEPFLSQAQELAVLVADKGASPEWRRCLSMGRMLIPGAQLFSIEGSDRIEFVGMTVDAEKALAQGRRLGDDERFTAHFQALADAVSTLGAEPPLHRQLELELAYLARRPAPLLQLRRLSEQIGGAQIHLKREDLLPQDTQLIISVVGQALLAQRLGRKTLVTFTVDGRRGVLTASIAARLGMEAVVFMTPEDHARHPAVTFRIRLLGARLMERPDEGGHSSDNAREWALLHWAGSPEETFVVFGLEGAPEPYTALSHEFAAVVGRECRRQLAELGQPPPSLLVARSGDNIDALALFPAFIADRQSRLVLVQPISELQSVEVVAGRDPNTNMRSSDKWRLTQSSLQGVECVSLVREHRWLQETGRVERVQAGESSAKRALRELARLEGIALAKATAYALGWACEAAGQMRPDQTLVLISTEDPGRDLWDADALAEGG
ncbi:MAG: pyridoxal-phosphate dependent enzyme [Nevskia sp.]|nr:pyridoxal-phosphate dependent enzyme [Nevskia sp.]